eukprot:Lankesteria_metandrocarpae@DN4138_c0_g1_i1.p1
MTRVMRRDSRDPLFLDFDSESIPFEEFAEKVRITLQDFFSSGAVNEVVDSLRALNCAEYLDYFPLVAIKMSLDKQELQQQKTAELLTVLYDVKVLSRGHLLRALEKLMQASDDLQLDVLDVNDRLMTFFMCAIEDHLIDDSFLRRLPASFLEGLKPTDADASAVADRLTELRSFKIGVADFEKDFFNSGQSEDVSRFLAEYPVHLRHEFVKELIKTSLGKTDWEREMVSKVLSECYGEGGVFCSDDIQLAFTRLLGYIDDLLLDCPDATILLAKFVVRAVVDEMLPPVFMSQQKRLRIGGTNGVEVMDKIQGWLKDKKDRMLSQQFRKIWTGTDPLRLEAREFKQDVRKAIFKYFDFHNVKETATTFNRMDLSPDQASEVVRKIMTCAMERKDCEVLAALELLTYLVEAGELRYDNVIQGFNQTYMSLGDLTIDIPNAASVLEQFRDETIKSKLLPQDYVDPVTANATPKLQEK